MCENNAISTTGIKQVSCYLKTMLYQLQGLNELMLFENNAISTTEIKRLGIIRDDDNERLIWRLMVRQFEKN